MIGIRSLKWARPRYVDAFGVEGVTPSPGRAWQGSGEASKNSNWRIPYETTHNSNYRGACRCGGCVRLSLLSKDE